MRRDCEDQARGADTENRLCGPGRLGSFVVRKRLVWSEPLRRHSGADGDSQGIVTPDPGAVSAEHGPSEARSPDDAHGR